MSATGVPHTILRDRFYLDLIPEMFSEQGLMRGPGKNRRVSWVAREDVIRVLASVPRSPDGRKRTLDLTGPEALTLEETTEQISFLVGLELRYQEESVEEGRRWRSMLGAPSWEVDTWLGSYQAISEGELAGVSGRSNAHHGPDANKSPVLPHLTSVFAR